MEEEKPAALNFRFALTIRQTSLLFGSQKRSELDGETERDRERDEGEEQERFRGDCRAGGIKNRKTRPRGSPLGRYSDLRE